MHYQVTSLQLITAMLENAKPDDNSCLVWPRSLDQDGYGHVRIDGLMRGAHRIAYQIVNGPIPAELRVCHHCDNPPCIRPSHLFTGSNLDNARDRHAKGRSAMGERLASKLTADKVREIRRLASHGYRNSELVKAFNVTHTMINKVISRATWTSI